jgi:hypothetical protein
MEAEGEILNFEYLFKKSIRVPFLVKSPLNQEKIGES